MKLTPLQRHLIETSYNGASQVLQQIKQKPLKGKDLSDMKTLEAAVQHLEVVLIVSR